MKKEEILHRLLEEKIISIVRLKNGEMVSKVIENLVQGGIRVLEITSNTPNFDAQITVSRKKYPDIVIGAGTIYTVEFAQRAISAGAQFLVTPNTNKAVVEEAIKEGIPVIMGAFTPTEVANAVSYGADIIKLFPAGQLGISYYKSLKGPFSNTSFFAVGGIGEANIKKWLEAGIDGIGIGSTLVKQEMNTPEDLENIILKANRFKEFIKKP
ncbi:bifunctional 4-hydroxy-2-oxoglutarate aldolase/2-dehydro-3-deoxy-phosphogluconate aldolase [Flagellimonas onchidii]|uniref:bifunctional 4-hydroxy-2-oxoglutarate aldolase/2-dehydro-3-deoxy-phosphogluconate aldolase n=1 Tax=Flagellimonas onchidii TaxID=2562684 RepID=UPI0010A69618|nr:bifunctional 4-hydroxy-2-oxoglutarate aldolase/2-dehydro-3-deoxy-phosphogluconate aldolase [Allomuricauda onchidii]